MSNVAVLVIAVLVFVFITDLLLFFWLFKPVLGARRANIPLTVNQVVRLRQQGLGPAMVIGAMVKLQEWGVETSLEDVAEVYRAHKSRNLNPDELARLVKEAKRPE